jgi:hypothetical protein
MPENEKHYPKGTRRVRFHVNVLSPLVISLFSALLVFK